MKDIIRPRKHRNKFLLGRSDLNPVKGSKYEEILRWAEKLNYVEFIDFNGEQFYTEFDLDSALLWKTKTQ